MNKGQHVYGTDWPVKISGKYLITKTSSRVESICDNDFESSIGEMQMTEINNGEAETL